MKNLILLLTLVLLAGCGKTDTATNRAAIQTWISPYPTDIRYGSWYPGGPEVPYYLYSKEITNGWGWETNMEGPYSASFSTKGTHVILFMGKTGDTGCGTNVVYISPISQKYRFALYFPDSIVHSNAQLHLINFYP